MTLRHGQIQANHLPRLYNSSGQEEKFIQMYPCRTNKQGHVLDVAYLRLNYSALAEPGCTTQSFL